MKKILIISIISFSLAAGALAMDLKESIDAAIKKNPTVIASKKSASAARAKLNQALSSFFPTINLTGDYDKAHSSPQTVQMTVGGVTQTINIGTNDTATVTGLQAALTQPVFVSSLFPQYGIAKKQSEAADENYSQTVINATFNVSQSYFGVLRAIKMAKLMSDSLEMAAAHRKQVQSMVNAGTATKADLLRSKVCEANANVGLIKAKYDIDASKDIFNNALGNDMKQPVALKDEGFSGKVQNLPEYEALLSIAYANRPDWKMGSLQVGVREDQLRLSQSEYLPSIVLSANSGNQLVKYPSFQSDVNSWKVAGMGSWKIFDSLARENKVAEASENLSAQRFNVDQLKNDIAMQVHSAYLNLKSALDVVIATQQSVDSAEESYKVSTSRYNAGMGTNVDVIDAQTDLTQAWTDHLDALFGVEIAKANINWLVGKVVL